MPAQHADVVWGSREGGDTLMIDGKSDTLDDKDNNDKVEIGSLELEWWIDYWYEEYRGLHWMISRLHLEFQDLCWYKIGRCHQMLSQPHIDFKDHKEGKDLI